MEKEQIKEEMVMAYDEAMNRVEVPRKNSRLITGQYYLSNKSCFKMADGVWHRVSNGKIGYICNHENGSWGFINNEMYPCLTIDDFGNIVVGFTSEVNSNFKLFCFNPMGKNAPHISENEPEKVLDEILIKNSKFTNLTKTLIYNFILNNSTFLNNEFTIFVTSKVLDLFGEQNISIVKHNTLDVEVFIEASRKYENYFSKIRTISDAYYSENLQYNFADSDYYKDQALKGYDKFESRNSDYDKLYKDVFKDKTFGVEIETYRGRIKEDTCASYGMVPLRDGSLEGGIEYTSIPYGSGKGIEAMLSFYEQIQKNCITHQSCSFHVHIGGYKRTRKSSLVLYKLCQRLQEELFDIMPIYKKSLQYWNSKREVKDHCQSLKGLYIKIKDLYGEEEDSEVVKKEFNKLFSFLTEGYSEDSEYNFENKNFPRKGQQKWNINSRYYWVNFIPFIFADQETVEFRIFNSPIDGEVALYYLLMSVAILNYAENHQDEVILGTNKITLEDVITNGLFEAPVVNNILKFIEQCRSNNFKDYIKKDWFAEIQRQNNKFGLSETIMSNISARKNKSMNKIREYFDITRTSPFDYYLPIIKKVEEEEPLEQN